MTFAPLPDPSPEEQAFMDRKRQQPGFGKRRYGVRIVVGRAYITLHKAATKSSA